MDYTYDIFSIVSPSHPLWVEAVVGLEQARRRLNSLAETKPGAYSIFDPRLARFVETYRHDPTIQTKRRCL